ncbi:hypothetical protein GE09DRAFT_1069657 [Coniochaeta sp. 2T2.1]|nr:hypothetical protein GE09DRAFT_1069657 [Coniochaeta sp. 2T2.1]
MWSSTFLLSLGLLALAATTQAAYTGPCSDQACGESARACPRGYLCVPYPNFNPADRKGCACSYG